MEGDKDVCAILTDNLERERDGKSVLISDMSLFWANKNMRTVKLFSKDLPPSTLKQF